MLHILTPFPCPSFSSLSFKRHSSGSFRPMVCCALATAVDVTEATEGRIQLEPFASDRVAGLSWGSLEAVIASMAIAT